MRLGFISEKFESGGAGPGTISHVNDDPGGKSYGIYQMSGELLSEFTVAGLFDLTVATLKSNEFDKLWTKIAEKYTAEFLLDQHTFVTRRLYLANIVLAKSVDFATWSRKIQEAVFSIAVQHGGACRIIQSAKPLESEISDVAAQVKRLYLVRSEYVSNLSLPERLKKAVLNRYLRELDAVLNIEESMSVAV